MKNTSMTIAKLFAVALICGSLAAVGCGDSNPLSSASTTSTGDPTQSQSNPTTQPEDATKELSKVSITVKPTSGSFNENSQIILTLKNTNSSNTANNKTEKLLPGATSIDIQMAIGSYQVTAEDESKFYKTSVVYAKVAEANTSVDISLVPISVSGATYNFYGELKDTTGKGIPFSSIVAKKTSGDEKITTTTNPDNGKYCLLGLTAGSYDITYSQSSFIESDPKNLTIDEDGTITFKEGNESSQSSFTDASGETYQGYKLNDVKLAPNIMKTGSIFGVICDSNGDPVKSTACDLYKRDNSDATKMPGKVLTFKTNANGYFYAKNLQPGEYSAVTKGSVPGPVTDGSGNITDYTFPAGTQYFSWMVVESDTTTPIPSITE